MPTVPASHAAGGHGVWVLTVVSQVGRAEVRASSVRRCPCLGLTEPECPGVADGVSALVSSSNVQSLALR